MNKADNNTSVLSISDTLLQDVLEGNNETKYDSSIVMRNFPGTLSENGPVAIKQNLPDINKNKPWREVIKRRFIYGGSDN